MSSRAAEIPAIPLRRASYAAPALDTTDLPFETRAIPRLALTRALGNPETSARQILGIAGSNRSREKTVDSNSLQGKHTLTARYLPAIMLCERQRIRIPLPTRLPATPVFPIVCTLLFSVFF